MTPETAAETHQQRGISLRMTDACPTGIDPAYECSDGLRYELTIDV